MRLDKRSSLVTALLVLTLSTSAYANDILLNQSGAIRGSGGAGVDGQYSVIFTIYNSPTSLVALWSEFHPALNVKKGLFHVTLGADEPFSKTMFSDNKQLWVGISVDGEPELPRRQMGAVALATVADYATTAASLSGPISSFECSGCIDTTDLADGAVTGAKIADGAIKDFHVAFVYAGSDVPGGAASKALDVECKGCVEPEALSFTPATLADVQALGPSLDTLNCSVGQSPQRTSKGWGCGVVQLKGVSNGTANGYEIVDGLGYTWDGLERAADTWQLATAKCQSMGARLPTVSELYRNRNNASGSVGQSYQGNYLWTQIKRTKTTSMIVRWSNGSVSYSSHSSKRNYRCVWPDEDSESFTGDLCFGGCFTTEDGLYNVDKRELPSMPMAAAVAECAARNARIPDLWELENAIRSGLPNGSGHQVWTGDQYKGNNAGPTFLTVEWSGTKVSWFPPQKFGNSNAYYGYWHDSTAPKTRCIGIKDRGSLTAPSGGEFVYEPEYIRADEKDRAKVQYLVAVDTCRNTGGHLMSNMEGIAMILAGLPNGSQQGVWTDEHYDLPILTLYWKDIAPDFWPNKEFVASGTGFGGAWFDKSHPFRCVYYPTRDWQEPTDQCKGGCFVKKYGDVHLAMDKESRPPSTYFSALDQCRALGARVPSTRDMEEMIRAGLPNGLGNNVWTSSSHVSSNSGPPKIAVRWAGIQTNWFPVNDFTNGSIGYSTAWPGEPQAYRCIWTNEVH